MISYVYDSHIFWILTAQKIDTHTLKLMTAAVLDLQYEGHLRHSKDTWPQDVPYTSASTLPRFLSISLHSC